jgi:hypothetical protein
VKHTAAVSTATRYRHFSERLVGRLGGLDTAVDRADAMGWMIVSMENDWKTVLPD